MIDELVKIIKESNNIVFFGGAGVSTESNIPDFRSNNGLYKKKTYPYPAEHMLSSDFFYDHCEEFYEFYFNEMIYPNAQANAAHLALAKLEAMGKLQAVITQNIDGLHQQAGSKKVYELHGSVHRNYCLRCHSFYDLDQLRTLSNDIPRCPKCNGIIKPDVVLYGEGLDQDTITNAVTAITNAEVLIVGGTSLAVYPAAGLLRYFRGKKLILINKETTSMDCAADLIIREPIAKVFEKVMECLYE